MVNVFRWKWFMVLVLQIAWPCVLRAAESDLFNWSLKAPLPVPNSETS